MSSSLWQVGCSPLSRMNGGPCLRERGVLATDHQGSPRQALFSGQSMEGWELQLGSTGRPREAAAGPPCGDLSSGEGRVEGGVLARLGVQISRPALCRHLESQPWAQSFCLRSGAEATGIACRHWEIWPEAPSSRPLPAALSEQVKLAWAPRKTKG